MLELVDKLATSEVESCEIFTCVLFELQYVFLWSEIIPKYLFQNTERFPSNSRKKILIRYICRNNLNFSLMSVSLLKKFFLYVLGTTIIWTCHGSPTFGRIVMERCKINFLLYKYICFGFYIQGACLKKTPPKLLK